MNRSPDTSPDAARTRRLALLAVPLAVLAFTAYAFSGLHAEADASAKPVMAKAAPSATTTMQAPRSSPASVDETPPPSDQDTELLAYHTHGG